MTNKLKYFVCLTLFFFDLLAGPCDLSCVAIVKLHWCVFVLCMVMLFRYRHVCIFFYLSTPKIRKLQLTKNDKTRSLINMVYLHLIFHFRTRGLIYIPQDIIKYLRDIYS